MKKCLVRMLITLTLAAAGLCTACDMMFIDPAGSHGSASEGEIAELEKNGRYLKLLNMPANTRAEHVKSCLISGSDGAVAKTDDAKGVTVSRSASRATVYISLVSSGGAEFLSSGSFFVSLSVPIDALTWINITLESKVLVDFSEGRGTLDVLSLTPGDTISPDWPVSVPEISEEERALEREGRYLKLVNMPANTLPRNVSSLFIADAHGTIAKLDTHAGVSVFRHTATHSAVYINLVSQNGSEFISTGPFFVILSVPIDAATWINITLDSRVVVDFVEGRGTLDVLSLTPGDTISPDWPVSEPDPTLPGGSSGGPSQGAIDEMERNGHYLMLYHLPAGTINEHISALSVSDGVNSVALPDTATQALLAADGVYVNAYLPLRSSSGGFFTRSGSFIVSFSVRIDALTSISVSRSDNVIVDFLEGRGTLDIEKLIALNPGVVDHLPDPETEAQIEDIIAGGAYIRFYNAPRNISKNSFSAVAVSNTSSALASPADYQAIAVRKNVLNAEAFVPLSSTRGGLPFSESGSFFVSFSIVADALTKMIVLPSYASLYEFDSGAADVNVQLAPLAPVKPPVAPHCLTLGGLPLTTGAPAVMEVTLYNTAGPVAKCPDYSKIYTLPFSGHTAAVVPLVYDNGGAFNGKPFADTGTFFVTFTVYPDAEHVITATLENNCLLYFSDGNAFFDVSNVPAVPRRTLTITGLPANTQASDVSNVFIHNQTGKVAQCPDYSLIQEISLQDSVTIRIPLVYSSNSELMFRETGPFYAAFDINADALTRFLISDRDHVTVGFHDGNGTLDASSLPIALPPSYLTIIGLPLNTAKGNFSEVFLYNAAGKVARCSNYADIIISKNATQASAMIPLAYDNNPQEFFRDSGEFVVSFVINVDVNSVIRKERADAAVVQFTDGSGEFSLSGDLGYLSVSLHNPSDLDAPVIKGGSIFEMNGGYEKITTHTAVVHKTFASTRVIYIYAVKSAGVLSFIYSDTAPSWNAAKNGYYNGNNRALFKMVYLKDAVEKYAAKKLYSEPWVNFEHYSIDSFDSGNTTSSLLSLSGSSNPLPYSLTPTAGWYVVRLAGAGGGGGGGVNGEGTRDYNGGKGGSGGYVTDLVYLPASTLTVFTGSGGYGSGTSPGYGYWQGAGGGGGGSGSFVYNPSGYLLCAGGGGGGGGPTADDGGGGGGGSGGSIGSGGGAGGGGGAHSSGPGSDGGKGGGYSGGSGGLRGDRHHGADAAYSLPGVTTAWLDGGKGGSGDDGGQTAGNGGGAAFADYPPPGANDWKNTAGVNGQGGNGGQDFIDGSDDRTANRQALPGKDGGNNRNANRGNGPSGGNGGLPGEYDQPQSAGKSGDAGYARIYRVY